MKNTKFKVLPSIIPGWIPSIKCKTLSDDLPPAKNAL